MFRPAGHSVVHQGKASPGPSDASIGKHHFVLFLSFAGPIWAVAARAPPLPFGLGIIVSRFSRRPPKEEAFRVISVTAVAPKPLWHDIYIYYSLIIY